VCSMAECLGIDLAKQSDCLSDLLLKSPKQWNDSAMLSCRIADGQWQSLTRGEVQKRVLRVAGWLQAQGVSAGDRVGVLGHNSIEWLLADFAILRLGAVTVPAYFTDPPGSVQYVFSNADCCHVLAEPGEQQAKLEGLDIPTTPLSGAGDSLASISQDASWDGKLSAPAPEWKDLATLIYTSGTTGRPKGVMLTHGNLLTDVVAGLGGVPIFPEDVFLSFLPLSHGFERTVGHFLAVASGGRIAYAEDVTTLMRDMPEVKPTVMISVPRLYEKIYAGVQEKLRQGPAVKRWLFEKAQSLGAERFELSQHGKKLTGGKALGWKLLDHLVNTKLRQKMGGRLRLFISGGAALSPEIARFLLAADIIVLPGYGLTEASPVLTVNRQSKIKPETVGPALPGVEFSVAEDGELLARGPMIMQGYWQRPEDTAEVLGDDGWLHTGDIVEIDEDGFIRIVDRKKEIMVLSNGENVPPALVEMRLQLHIPSISQAMAVGEGRQHVTALIVPDEEALERLWEEHTNQPLPSDWRNDSGVHTWFQQCINQALSDLPSFMQVEGFRFVEEPWTQDNGMLTPTLKIKRRKILELHATDIDAMYAE